MMTDHQALPINVLLVEDSEHDADLVRLALTKAGIRSNIHHVDTEAEFLKALAPDLDVILADFEVPSFGAIRVLDLLRTRGSDVPLIVVSGSIGEDIAVQMLRSGAADYLLKDRLARLGQAVLRAIEDRKHRAEKEAVERALKVAEARMRFALEAARVGVWEFDIQSGIQVWSETLEALHGLPSGGFQGTTDAWLACIHPEDVEQVKSDMALAVRRGGDSGLTYRTIWPDGSVRWLAGLGRTFYDESGRPLRAAGISWDITERRELEQQYRQSQKMEAVGLLAGGVAHDFNNLLTVIQGFCTLALEGLGPASPQSPDLLQIKGAAERAAGLTRQLLAFSRKQTMESKVLDVRDVLTNLEPMLKRLVREDVTMTLAGRPEGRIRGDAGLVEQVIVNLVVNALDAMPEGGTLLVEAEDVEFSEPETAQRADFTPGAYVMLAVTDSGTGMDDATKARIFEPFFTTKAMGRGTGLGLATVYGIVKQSGGHIWVYSEPGHGSTFKIYFPRVDDPLEEEVEGARSALTRGTETILVAEDEESLRLLIGRVLGTASYKVLMATSALHALEMARTLTAPIDVLLTDVIMPQMAGPVLAEKVREVCPSIRVLFMSGYTDNAVVERAGLDREIPFLQKPFAPDVLLRKIREVLDAPPGH